MYVCVCVYYKCLYVCMCVCVLYVLFILSENLRTCQTCAHILLLVVIYMCVCMYLCIYVSMYVSMYLCMYLCVYMYIYIYICMHEYIYTYIYINILYVLFILCAYHEYVRTWMHIQAQRNNCRSWEHTQHTQMRHLCHMFKFKFWPTARIDYVTCTYTHTCWHNEYMWVR